MFGCFELKLILVKIWYVLDNFCIMELLLFMYCCGIIIVVIVLVIGFLLFVSEISDLFVVMWEV